MHTGGVKPPPDCLPPANSPKWHGRRHWNWLGYFRVRTLTNPMWRRDPVWLLGVVRRERARSDEEAPMYDGVIEALRRYVHRYSGRRASDPALADDRDRDWDVVLAAIDDLLVHREREHLRSVREGGASGPDVPEG